MIVCTQLGIHCTVELSERSEACRLPVCLELQYELGYHVAVTKGVGLLGSQGN